MNNRRKLVIAIGAGALTAPLAAFAQQPGKVWRVGFLWENEPSYYAPRLDAFRVGMRELGYTEGRDYAIEQRTAENDITRLTTLAELLALKVDVIVSSGTPSAVAAHKATHEIPILTVTAGDPVGSGLAATLRRPGSNVTGLTGLTTELFTKRLDLLRQILPNMRRVGFLYNPDNVADTLGLRQFDSDCAKLGFNSIRAPVRKAEEIVPVFKSLQRNGAQGLIVTNSVTNNAWRVRIVERAAKHRLPTIYSRPAFTESGGLISYATDGDDLYRRAAAYADKIFKGAKPGELPIEQPLKFETVINLKTAKALGIKIPDIVMLRAEKVIE
jgi:putative ABC transport system substrate-binding protein